MYLLVAILAYFLNSIAVTIDKFLLTKTIPHPLIYIFYFSLVSVLALFLIPFTTIPTFEVFILASSATLFWTIGAYLMFTALKTAQVQRVIPIIGVLTPLILLIIASFSNTLIPSQILAIVLLILGLVFLTLPDWRGKLTQKELILELLAALFFALNYLLLYQAFLNSNFLTVLVWSKPILIPLGLIILIIPSLRKIIFEFNLQKPSLTKAVPLFMFGQISAGISEFLLVFSISLANPALVNSLQGVKYLFIFIFSLMLGKKFPEIFAQKYNLFIILTKILGILLIGVGLYLLAFI